MPAVALTMLVHLASLFAPMLALAQTTPATWPAQSVKILVPVSAGSSTDILMRAISDRLARVWPHAIIVENRPGLAGVSAAAKSPPDGHTMIIVSNGHTAIGVLNKSLSFDPVNDFVGVAQVAAVPMLMVAPTTMPVANLTDWLAHARKRPGELNIASAGPGTSSNIVAELFKHHAGIKTVTLHFRGAPEAHLSVMRGDSHAYFTSVPQGLEYIKSNRERGLGVSAERRIAALPDLPTIDEAGLPGFTQGAWYGLLAPVATPRTIVEQINRDVSAVVTSAEMASHFEKEGVLPVTASAAVFDRLMRDETVRVARIFKELGLGQQ